MFITAAATGVKRPREAEVNPIPQAPTYNVAELGFDPMRGIPTPGAGKCGCGFSAGTSGLCSACYRALSIEDKIARCKEQQVLQVERNKKIKEDEARAVEEKAKQAAIEQKKRAETAAEIAKAEEANMERKNAGKCYIVRPLFDAHDCSWNLWGFDTRPVWNFYAIGTIVATNDLRSAKLLRLVVRSMWRERPRNARQPPKGGMGEDTRSCRETQF